MIKKVLFFILLIQFSFGQVTPGAVRAINSQWQPMQTLVVDSTKYGWAFVSVNGVHTLQIPSSRLAYLDKSNTFTGTPQIFSRISVDTINDKSNNGGIVLDDTLTSNYKIVTNSYFESIRNDASLILFGTSYRSSTQAPAMYMSHAYGTSSSPLSIPTASLLHLR